MNTNGDNGRGPLASGASGLWVSVTEFFYVNSSQVPSENTLVTKCCHCVTYVASVLKRSPETTRTTRIKT